MTWYERGILKESHDYTGLKAHHKSGVGKQRLQIVIIFFHLSPNFFKYGVTTGTL